MKAIMKNGLCAIAVVILLGAVQNADAYSYSYSSPSGELGASVDFSTSGTDLLVTLTNTDTGDPSVPTDILTGLVFSITGNPLLTGTSATLHTDSIVIRDDAPTGGVVGGEWAYNNNLLGTSFFGQSAIYSAGYFSGNALFPGDDLEPPVSVDGIQYGITTMFDNAANDNGGIATQPFIQNSVDFVLSGLPVDFAGTISEVTFLYGTSLSENPPPPVPEPGTMMLLGIGMLGLAVFGKRRMNKEA